jgi:propanol-preferring alcohol dehydrogenase
MRAMVLEQPKPAGQDPLRLLDLPVPVPGPSQIRVRVSHCALCHTDLHIVEGDLPPHKLPLVPGHQIVGQVDACGPYVRMVREGDRVGIPWLNSSDGDCVYCLGGHENLCNQARFTGYDADGGYAEYVTVGEDFAYPLPSVFTSEHAAPLLCAGIIGYRSYRLSGVGRGQRLGLYGFGASAHIVLQFARHLGNEVYVFTRTAAHRELASRLGAAWVGEAGQQPSLRLDAAIIFAPAGELVPHALRGLRKGGTVALAGITMTPIPQMDYDLIYQERLLRSVANATRQDAREFLELAADVPVETEVQLFPLAEANAALQALKLSRIDGAGVLKI